MGYNAKDIVDYIANQPLQIGSSAFVIDLTCPKCNNTSSITAENILERIAIQCFNCENQMDNDELEILKILAFNYVKAKEKDHWEFKIKS